MVGWAGRETGGEVRGRSASLEQSREDGDEGGDGRLLGAFPW